MAAFNQWSSDGFAHGVAGLARRTPIDDHDRLVAVAGVRCELAVQSVGIVNIGRSDGDILG